MTAIMSSWKEIAQYLGKGVRTVQRWERERGLPVRRSGRGLLLAIPKEIDSWVRTQYQTPEAPADELTRLRREVAALREHHLEEGHHTSSADADEVWELLKETPPGTQQPDGSKQTATRQLPKMRDRFRQSLDQTSSQLLLNDADLALTFTEVAETTRDPKRRDRAIGAACKAYLLIQQKRGLFVFSENDGHRLESTLREIKARLENAGQLPEPGVCKDKRSSQITAPTTAKQQDPRSPEGFPE
jgi:hypothetical protein